MDAERYGNEAGIKSFCMQRNGKRAGGDEQSIPLCFLPIILARMDIEREEIDDGKTNQTCRISFPKISGGIDHG